MASEHRPDNAPDAAGLLLIDAGNSRIKWAIASGAGVLLLHGALADTETGQAATGSDREDGTGAPGAAPLAARPGSVWISNVAGSAGAQRIAAWLDAHWPGLPRHTIAASAAQCGVRNGYRAPAQLGSDRWASLIGAHAAYPGEHLLIATCGTATTLECLHADGYFDGGLIAPGLRLMMQSLGQHTAQLPSLSDVPDNSPAGPAGEPQRTAPARFARDTCGAIGQACLLAQSALIERAWHDCSAQLDAPVRLLLGGGAADAIAPALRLAHTRHDHLALQGLARIAMAGDTAELTTRLAQTGGERVPMHRTDALHDYPDSGGS